MVDSLLQITSRSALTLITPYLLMAIGFFSLSFLGVLSVDQLATLRLVPYSLFIVSAAISLYFGRNRIFYLSLVMAFLHWGMTSYYPYINATKQAYLLLMLGLLAPFNLAVLSLLRDRGLTLVQSYVMASVLGLQIALVVEVLNGHLSPGLSQLEALFTLVPWPAALEEPLSKPVWFSLVLSGLVIGTRIIFRMTPLNNALLAVLLAMGFAFYFANASNTVVMLFVVAGLISLLSLLQHSYDMAYRDELTGLLGRRALNERLLRLSGRYCIVMVDVDHFKKFNDTHGHEVGDQVLKMLAGQLEKTTGGAKAYRYGGEEFTLIFEGKTAAQIEPHLEALRGRVADYPMQIRGNNRPNDSKKGKKQRAKGKGSGPLKVTISLGAAVKTDKLRTPALVIEAADKALYSAKKSGRNRVKFSS